MGMGAHTTDKQLCTQITNSDYIYLQGTELTSCIRPNRVVWEKLNLITKRAEVTLLHTWVWDSHSYPPHLYLSGHNYKFWNTFKNVPEPLYFFGDNGYPLKKPGKESYCLSIKTILLLYLCWDHVSLYEIKISEQFLS